MSAIRNSASKTRSRRRSPARGRFVKITCAVAACLLSVWLGVQASHPYLLASRLRAANDDIEREILRYRLQNQRDEKEVQELRTKSGLERAGRSLGWTLPGEQKLRIPER